MILAFLKKVINPNVHTYKYTKHVAPKKFGSNIGSHTYGHLKILGWENETELKIGKFCSIAKDVTILLGGEHRVDWVSTYPFSGEVFKPIWPEAEDVLGHPRSKGNVVIGNDVWIGFGATILSGLTIGNGAVIGARSVVTKDVEPYAIVAGNPAKLIRKRFSDGIIRDLSQIRWWDWPEEKIKANLKYILSPDVKAFCRKFLLA